MINQEGKYFVSTYKNSVVRKFGSGSNNLAGSSAMSFAMNNSLNLSSTDAKRQLSMHLNYDRNGIGHVSSLRNATPGPGSYRIISEFGKYDMAGFNNTSTSPAMIETSSTTPVKRAFSAMGSQGRRKRAQSSMGVTNQQQQ